MLGGRSEIGLAVARRLASGARVVLAARRADGTLTADVTGDAGAVDAFYSSFDLQPAQP